MRLESEKKPNLLVYGGTFDPPHLGHRHCLEQAVQAFPQADILVLPGYQPAGAGGDHKLAVSAFAHRMAMSRINFSGLNLDGQKLEVSELEKNLPVPNFSFRTMIRIRQEFPDCFPLFVMGDDQWEAFSRWKHPEVFLRETSVLVVPRSERADIVSLRNNSLAMLKHLQIEAKLAYEGGPLDLVGSGRRIWISDTLPYQVSSTHIRNHIEATQDRTLNSEFLHAGVLRYIEQHQLYRGV